jgi:hypothetical protein
MLAIDDKAINLMITSMGAARVVEDMNTIEISSVKIPPRN